MPRTLFSSLAARSLLKIIQMSVVMFAIMPAALARAQIANYSSSENSATALTNIDLLLNSIPGVNRDYLLNSNIADYNSDGALTFAAFGDSITRGVGDTYAVGDTVHKTDPIDVGEAGYPLRVETVMGINVFNLGDPGETLSEEGLVRFAEKIPNLRPDIVFIGGGSNDAFSWISESDFFRSAQTMINIARASGSFPILHSTPPSCCEHSGIATFTEGYNRQLETLAAVNDLPFSNVNKGFTNTCKSSKCYLLNLPEGLHPNIEGYDVMGEVVMASLLNIDLFAPNGPQSLELALNLPPGSVKTVPDAVLSSNNAGISQQSD
ncbi:MAG: hypothetical protein IT291_07060 [Deltaproteobacteria bacterium]|nr:hypothetical protein [Deltaproteobacteria bacterium]